MSNPAPRNEGSINLAAPTVRTTIVLPGEQRIYRAAVLAFGPSYKLPLFAAPALSDLAGRDVSLGQFGRSIAKILDRSDIAAQRTRPPESTATEVKAFVDGIFRNIEGKLHLRNAEDGGPMFVRPFDERTLDGDSHKIITEYFASMSEVVANEVAQRLELPALGVADTGGTGLTGR